MTNNTRREFIKTSAGLACSSLIAQAADSMSTGLISPNILWINVEDMSCHFGYQGEPLVKTPHVDRLANEGLVYRNAYVTCPVCSPSRSALITGMYQTAIGAHHHRSSRGAVKNHLPPQVKTLPEMFREAGYYVCNANHTLEKPGKTDYNFVYDNKTIYDGANWSGHKPDQPFFAQIQLRGGKMRNGNAEKWNQTCRAELDNFIEPEDVTLPPYYPDTELFRRDWAEYLNCVQYTDMEVGRIIERLKNENLLENTFVFFFTDHGISQARGKQFAYDEGAKIPLILWGGLGPIKTIENELVSHIDIAATSLQLAGIQVPDWMQAKPLPPYRGSGRDFVVTARDRCDETTDRIRSVRKGNFKYIRNFYPKRPYLQPNVYKDKKPWMAHLRELYAEGKLNKTQSLHLAEVRPEEELYDLSKDKWEINNLAGDPTYQDTLRELRGILANWVIESDDKGRFPEPESNYDSDMEVYIAGKRSGGREEETKTFKQNIERTKRWKAEGI